MPQRSMTAHRSIVEDAAVRPRPSARGLDGNTPTPLPEPAWRRAKVLIVLRPLMVTAVIGTALLIDMPDSSGVPLEFGIFLLGAELRPERRLLRCRCRSPSAFPG